MNDPFIEIPSGNFMIQPFNVESPEGYVPRKDYPECCNYHTTILQNLIEWFARFPNCCEPHREMAGKWWFNKSTYDGISHKIMNCVAYTEHHIATRIDDKEWFKDISDYIEFILYAFGTPAIGADRYLSQLKEELQDQAKDEKPSNKEKVRQIIQYIEAQGTPEKEQKMDLNAVYSTYQKWLKAFPFNLFPFTRIKDHFHNQLPLIKGKMEYNPYLGFSKGKPHTSSSLIEFLCGLTEEILEKINTAGMVTNGEISDTKMHVYNLIAARHHLKQSSLLKQYKKGELRYMALLKSWLKNEKAFFNEINPVFENTPESVSANSEKTSNMKIPTQLKELSGILKELDFGYFLQSKAFENLLIKTDFDDLWDEALRHTNPGDTIYVGNTDAHEGAFFFLFEQLWTHNKPKFYSFATVVITGLIKGVKTDQSYTELQAAVEKIGFSKENIDTINLAADKANPTAPKQTLPPQENKKIFIGHGRNSLWREVEAYLREENLPFESFQTNDRTGEHIIDILKGFLDNSSFAIIVVTAEDETANGTVRARQNVIHEIGLFQGRLGFDKVAILKQDEAEPFSNNDGLQHIPFPKGNIQASFHQLGLALKKAGLKK